MDAKPTIDQIHKKSLSDVKLLEFLDSAAQIITSNKDGDVWFTSLDLKYVFGQIPLMTQLVVFIISTSCVQNRRALIASRLDFLDLPIYPKFSKNYG